MSWEEGNRSCQQRKSVGAEPCECLRNRRYTRLVRGAVILFLGIITVAGIATQSWNRTVYAAPAAQSGASNSGTLAIVGASGANLYSTPGGESISELAPGTVLTAVGRSADNLWVVIHNDSDLAGWMEVSDVVLFGLEQLPVMVEGTQPLAAPTTGANPGGAPVSEEPVLLPTVTATPWPSPTPTASPTPTETPIPSPTPSPMPTATATPTRAVVAPSVRSSGEGSRGGEGSLVAVVRGGGAALYDQPDGTEIQQLPTGTALTAWGRTEDGQWLVVMVSSGAAGWVQTDSVVIFNIEGLAVLDSTTGLPAASGSASSEEPESTSDTAEADVKGNGATAPTEPTDPDGITATVAITDSRLNIRSGPGTNFALIGKAEPAETFEVSGRNAAATWLELVTPDLEDGYGWVAAEFMSVSRPILSVTVSERADQAVPQSVPQASATPGATAEPIAEPALASSPVVVRSNGSAAATGLRGTLVFQSSNGGTIYAYHLESGELTPLSTGIEPAISPDGKTVAFTRFGGDQGLYLIDIDGKNERRIWSGGEALRSATWSPDGKWIAFVRLAGSFKCRDVGFGICLPDNPFLEDFPMSSLAEFGLSRVDFNGENYRDIDALNTVQAPSWHTDGIVYHASTGLEITADQPVVETKALIQAPYYQDPAWQPNGNRIIFQSREGSHWEIFTINRNGAGLSALTRPATALVDEMPSNVSPAWSPDGQAIVFLSNRDAENSAGAWRLWVMDADGSNQRPLPVDVELDYSYVAEQMVSWGAAS